jgi:hypothetical protein
VRTRQAAIALLVAAVVGVALINSHRRSAAHRAIPQPAPSASQADQLDNVHLLNCAVLPAGRLVTDIEQPWVVPGHRDLTLISMRCADSSGLRNPSQVQVLDDTDDHRVVATLIRPGQDLHVASVTTEFGSVAVLASLAELPPGHSLTEAALGSVSRYLFTLGPDFSVHAQRPQVVAPSCAANALTLTVVLGKPVAALGSRTRLATSATVVARNDRDAACAIEGPPSVQAQTAAGTEVSASYSLDGPTGGVTSSTAPPVLVLRPGARASAAIDSTDLDQAGGTALCDTSARLSVAAPNGTRRTVAARLRFCALQVHPFVPGTTGTDN